MIPVSTSRILSVCIILLVCSSAILLPFLEGNVAVAAESGAMLLARQDIGEIDGKSELIETDFSLKERFDDLNSGENFSWLGWIAGIFLIVFAFTCLGICVLVFMNRRLRNEIEERKRAEEKLKLSESRFREILEGVSEISIQGYDENRKVIFWNNASEKLYGYSRREALGEKLEDLIIPSAIKAHTIEQIQRWIDFGEKIPSGELDLVGKDKRMISVYSSHVMLENAEGKEMFCIDIDINPVKLSEEALLKSKELLFALFDTAEDAIFIKDIELNYKKVNPAMEKFFDLKSKDIVGKSDIVLLGKNAAEDIQKVDRTVLGGERVQQFTEAVVGNDLCFFHTIKVPLKNLEGKITGICGITRNITEQKRAEEIIKSLFAISNAVSTTHNLDDLYRSIHLSLSNILDVTNFFIAVVDRKAQTLHFPYHVDIRDHSWLSVSFDAENSLTGLVLSIGAPVFLTKPELDKRAADSGVLGPVPQIWMGVPLTIKDEIIGIVAVQSYDDPDIYNRKDLMVLSAVSDQIALAIDRKRSEDALRASEKEYRHLFNNAPAGMCEVDLLTGKFTSVNGVMSRYTGYSEKELLSMDVDSLFIPDIKGRGEERFTQLFDDKQTSESVEYKLLNKNDESIAVIINNELILTDKVVVGVRAVVHDITDLKLAEKEKREAQRLAAENEKMALVGQIAGKMAHDFNNILGIIMGNSELALLECKDPDTKRTLDLIFKQTIRGKNLTKNLVAFAKDQEPRQEYFLINEKIDLVVNLLKKDLEGIELIKDYIPGIPELLADPGMIEHAIVNMLQNSIHGTSLVEKPVILLKTYCTDTEIFFEIEDNGCGIPEEFIDNIYDPSFTLKGKKDTAGSYEEHIKGSGYGMANVKKYIEQHKGSIAVKSTLGASTTFTVRLPIIEKELTSEEKKEIESEQKIFDRYILLVEDEQAISDVQYKILTSEPCNHRVDIASNGRVAIDLFNRNRYDFVSLDYVLPGKINGMDVYEYIRKTDRDIPVLFISGNIQFLESIKELKQENSNIDHLSKPCQNRDYVKSINGLLEKSSGRSGATTV